MDDKNLLSEFDGALQQYASDFLAVEHSSEAALLAAEQAVVEATVASGTVAAGSSGALKTGLLAGGTALLVAGAIALGLAGPEITGSQPDARAELVSVPSAETLTIAAPVVGPLESASVAADVEEFESEPVPDEATASEPSQPRARRKAAAAEKPKPAAQAAGASDFREELQLLERARTALRASNPSKGLRALEEHARRFPKGELARERDATRVTALCQAGRSDAAQKAAARYFSKHGANTAAFDAETPCN
jgi:hypothetical protein